MIDLYFWPTGNGKKIALILEELQIEYRIIWVDINNGDQFKPDFLAISPNNRMPAIVDHSPRSDVEEAATKPISIFESGAILQYLAEKHGQFYYKPGDTRQKVLVDQWLFWQIGGLGPMAGQAHHFRLFAKEKVPYGIKRYTDESNRLYGVMDRQLANHEYFANEYSIADMAIYPWVISYERHGQNIDDFPHVKRWYDQVSARPAVQRMMAIER